jgi:antagonist of KipI
VGIIVQKEGILSSLQDLGRDGFRNLGINPSGAMDKIAVRLINILLGNDEAEAVLEMHFPAPEILFEEDAIFALGGADFHAKLNNKKLENWKPYFTEKGSILKFSKKTFGMRAYLSVKGGFRIEKWLGSASTNLSAEIGGFSGRKLQKFDKINFNRKTIDKKQKSDYKISNSLTSFYSRFPIVRVVVGAEFELLTASSENAFLRQNFAITQNSNRMGFRLEGKPLYLLHKKELVSSAVSFGTIQLLPDGQIIILMADHQTSGGYPRIANVVEIDLPLVAQLGTNDKIAFRVISLEEAENLILHTEFELNHLKFGMEAKLR